MSTTKSSAQRLILYDDPAPLQKLSAVVVAAQLWRREIVKNGVHAGALNVTLPLAKSIPGISTTTLEQLMDKYVELTRRFLLLWVKLHHLRIFFPYEKEYDILTKYFDCISWRADGNVDYELTSEKLIACTELSPIYKYKLACMYCREDDIRSLWNNLPDTYHDLTFLHYNANSLLRYWDCRMKVDPTSSGSSSMDGRLFDKLQPDTWSAWKYCWLRLSPDQQIDKATALVDSRYDPEIYVKNLIPLLTKLQLVKILKKCSKDIVVVLATSPENVKFALQTWQFIKNFVSSDSFVKMFVSILNSDLDVNRMLFTSFIEYRKRTNDMKFVDLSNMTNVNVSGLLYEIWQNSPERLRMHLVDKHAAKILQKLSKMDHMYTMKTLCRDVRLMLELLSRSDYLINNTFWRKHWTDLIKGVRSSRLNEIIKLCFRNDKEIAKFKKAHMSVYSKIEWYCNDLIYEGHWDELNDFLSFCTSDPSTLMGLKRSILVDSSLTLRFCVFYSDNPAKMRAFDEFICAIYSDPDRRKNFKRQMVTSLTNFKRLERFISDGVLIPVKNFVTLFLTQDAELKDVKKSLKQHCLSILNKGDFDSFNVDNWNEFLLWCSNENQQQLDQLRESISLSDIYSNVFLKCVKDIESRMIEDTVEDDKSVLKAFVKDTNSVKAVDSMKKACFNSRTAEALKELPLDRDNFVDDYLDVFDRLNYFLLWYFASKAKVDEFKAAKMKKRSVQRKISAIKNDRLMKVVLYWFFNRDVEKIQSFIESLNR